VGPLTSPICSLDAALEIALDASVIINLNASGRGRDILRALQHPAVVVDVVRNELGKGLRSNRHDTIGLDDLVTDGVVRAVSLGGGSLEIFEALVVGMAADTLAYAVHSGAIAAIDERKATRICKSKYPAVALVSTTHLLACKEVLHTLGRDGLCEAVYMALRNGRMQVPPQDLEWVLDLIGTNRAAQCLSLPKSVRPVG
jgi:hypothetical protein